MEENVKYTAKDYLNKVLGGTASGIVIGLIANAILGSVFKALIPYGSIFVLLSSVVTIMQFITPAIIGVLVAMQFKMNGMESVIIGAATFLGSGAYKVTEAGVQLVGIGDLINVMIVSAIAVYVTRLLQGRLGSLTLILMPIIVGAGVGTIGLIMLPYVGMVTSSVGNLINSFTTLQPLLMTILISVAFAILIISPISTVAIGIAIGVAGLGAGAAAVGVTACTAILVIGSLRINQSGTTLAILLGAMKMMIPNLIKYPKIMVPIVLNAIVSGVGVYMLTIQGTPQTAGFGIVGLVGPIQAFNMGTSLISVALAYFIIPFVGGFLIDMLCNKVLRIYEDEIFKFIPASN
ncbi:PTS sugar transporter subunit IIC [Desemzia sp. RIT804]|uniref:PTS transporter subunit IIC n=1 Tax=Desemzia sp. RIT 804 TaxID=2810209 RepID=UPI00194E3C38|nr:PTS sugar transporter subunit IIC [Desemzia sp. RIT 804]MBM6614803.1 PTS sugar transporter subunit IIC [Desemzia sp. RIT 804]